MTMKGAKHFIPTVLVVLLFSGAFAQLCLGQKGKRPGVKPGAVIPIDEITSVIRSAFGQSMEVVTDTRPFYLLGDFNGDSFADIAVLVNPEKGKAELKQHNVKYIDVDPSSPTTDKSKILNQPGSSIASAWLLFTEQRKDGERRTQLESISFMNASFPFASFRKQRRFAVTTKDTKMRLRC